MTKYKLKGIVAEVADWLPWLLLGVIAGAVMMASYRGCDDGGKKPVLTGSIDTSFTPKVTIVDSVRVDTTTIIVENIIYIERAQPTASDSTMARLDTTITDGEATAKVSAIYDKRGNTFTLWADLKAAVQILERFVYRNVTVEVPRLVQVTEPDTDDWWYFGAGATAGVAAFWVILHFIFNAF
jgi:hypothetical protein